MSSLTGKRNRRTRDDPLELPADDPLVVLGVAAGQAIDATRPQLLEDDALAGRRITRGPAQVEELLTRGRGWAIGQRPAGDEKGAREWWVIDTNDWRRPGAVGSRSANALYFNEPGRTLRRRAAEEPPQLIPELGAQAFYHEWVDGDFDFCMAYIVKSDGENNQLLDAPHMEALRQASAAEAAARIGRTRCWLICRRLPFGGSGDVFGDGSEAAAEWWAVGTKELTQPRAHLGSRTLRSVHKHAVQLFSTIPASLHPSLGLPAVWDAWDDEEGGETYELVLANPVAGRDCCDAAGAGAELSDAAAAAAVPPAPIWGTHVWVLGRRQEEEGGGPAAAAAAAPAHYSWLPVTAATLKQSGTDFGGSSMVTLYGTRCRRLVASFRGGGGSSGRLPEPCSLLPGAPHALVETWGGGSYFVALVNPVVDYRRAPRACHGRRDGGGKGKAGEGRGGGGSDSDSAGEPAPEEARDEYTPAVGPHAGVAALRAWLGLPPLPLEVQQYDDDEEGHPAAAGAAAAAGGGGGGRAGDGGVSWANHQWVLGRRPQQQQQQQGAAAAVGGEAEAPFLWLPVTASVLMASGNARLGSESTRGVYLRRGGRLRAAFQAGQVPAPFAALPGAPPALVEEWDDAGGGERFFLALVKPVPVYRHARRRRSSGGGGGARAAPAAAEEDDEEEDEEAGALEAAAAQPGSSSGSSALSPTEGAGAAAALRAWLGMPPDAHDVAAAAAAGGAYFPNAAAAGAAAAAGGWAAHQWVLGRRLLAPLDGGPGGGVGGLIDWLGVSAAALQTAGITIGSASAKTVYVHRCGRLRSAFRSGRLPEPCALLPGTPPALVEEWTDAGRTFLLALVNPVAVTHYGGQSRRHANAAQGGGAALVPQASGASAAATLCAWLGQPLPAALAGQASEARAFADAVEDGAPEPAVPPPPAAGQLRLGGDHVAAAVARASAVEPPGPAPALGDDSGGLFEL